MGLDTTHDCWHGAYSAFMRWRIELAKAAGLPPLRMMEGFVDPADTAAIESGLPIKWECLKPDAIHELLYHSDCEGKIPWKSCAGIADSLERLIPKLPKGDAGGHIGDWAEKTQAFVDGLRTAVRKKENVIFH